MLCAFLVVVAVVHSPVKDNRQTGVNRIKDRIKDILLKDILVASKFGQL